MFPFSLMSRSLFQPVTLDSEDTNQLKISNQLGDFYAEVAAAIRQRMSGHPNVTHDDHGVRLLNEDAIKWFEGKANQSKRGISI